uniref:Uncharacterized protein n=1 Tax=Arundo donax TaxID=35708 RepID=A0A0A9BR17_ARUDO
MMHFHFYHEIGMTRQLMISCYVIMQHKKKATSKDRYSCFPPKPHKKIPPQKIDETLFFKIRSRNNFC